MPPPLFFHLAMMLWRKLELVKLPFPALPLPDSHHPCSYSPTILASI